VMQIFECFVSEHIPSQGFNFHSS